MVEGGGILPGIIEGVEVEMFEGVEGFEEGGSSIQGFLRF